MAARAIKFECDAEENGLPSAFAGYRLRNWTCADMIEVISFWGLHASTSSPKMFLYQNLIAASSEKFPGEFQDWIDDFFEERGISRDAPSTAIKPRKRFDTPPKPVRRTELNSSFEGDAAGCERPSKMIKLALDPSAEHLAATFSGDGRQCTSCLEFQALHQFPNVQASTECEHKVFTTCIGCLADYITSQVSAVSLDAVPCPEANCSSILSYHQMKQYAPRDIFARMDDYLLNKILEESLDFFKCANKSCQYGASYDPNVTNYFVCPQCGSRTCTTCASLEHPDLSCEDSQKRIRDADVEKARREQAVMREEERSAKYLDKHTRFCPKCNVPIKKAGGCDHMTCRQCRYEFCWGCLADYNAIRREGNAAHKRECRWYG